jgi:hypothetical protein
MTALQDSLTGTWPRTAFYRVWIAAGVVSLTAGLLRADEITTAKGEAPRDHALVRHVRGGGYFVAKGLKEEYDRLLDQIKGLKADLATQRIGGADARIMLRRLQAQLDELRKNIEDQKVLVALKAVKQSETITFDPGPERLLIITADNIRVSGWDEPHVKCVLEKLVLAPDDKPVDDHLQGLKLSHKHGQAPNLVGSTPAEREAQERDFLASPDGMKLTAEQRTSRHRLVQQIAGSYAVYAEFQGKKIDTVEIEGLTFEDGNRQVTVDVASKGGSRIMGSDWQRHAALTVYVPRCQQIALRGCLAGVDVSDVHSSVVMTSDGSRNRDYNAAFRVRELYGSLVVDDAPLDLAEAVHGNLTITATSELVNSGSYSEEDEHVLDSPPARELICRDVDGDLTGWFTRTDLVVSDVAGRIDVRNEFGDTRLSVRGPLTDKPHRVISEAGRIEVQLASGALGGLPLQALTNCGRVRTNLVAGGGQDVSWTTTQSADGSRRNWYGINSKTFRQGGDSFNDIQRLDAVLSGTDRTSGLDLISRAGTVAVTIEK